MAVEILKDTANGTALSTLADDTVLSVESGHGTGMLQSFLCKKVSASISISGLAADQPVIVGMARGEANVTQIKTAITQSQLERDAKDQAEIRDVLHETLRVVDSLHNNVEITVSLGGGKGIPFEDGDGWQWFVYNFSGGSLTTGAKFHGNTTYYGVFL